MNLSEWDAVYFTSITRHESNRLVYRGSEIKKYFNSFKLLPVCIHVHYVGSIELAGPEECWHARYAHQPPEM